jgi:hypothetical protein
LARVILTLLAVAALLAPAARAAATLDCPRSSVEARIDGADAVFVGRLLSARAATRPGERFYRFVVDQRVKGPLGHEVEVLARPLTDARGTPLARDVAVGVFATLDGATFRTGSCSLIDPGTLLATADEPRGGGIKVAIGLVILALVLAYSVRRLRRRNRSAGTPPAA